MSDDIERAKELTTFLGNLGAEGFSEYEAQILLSALIKIENLRRLENAFGERK
jgi:hypothetical protein